MKLFTEQEIRAAAIFLPLALLAMACVLLVRPRHDPAAALEAERQAEQQQREALHPKPFDPNTATYDELRAMGLTQTEAAGLLRFRAGGKIFQIPEDVATCYVIDDSLYRQLRPYIRIGRKYAKAPTAYRKDRMVARPLAPQPFRIDTVSARYLRATGLMSQRQAEVFIRWRDSHPLRDMEEVGRSYVVDDSLAQVLARYLIFPEPQPALPLEINEADSAALCTLRGIGPKTAGEIVAYRERLGGFVRAEQLAEVRGMTEANYERILQQICCDSCKIRKIHINFAAPKQLAAHPYISLPTFRKLNKRRQLKGGWSSAEALYEENILKPDEARRLAPYLSFELPGDTTDE